MYKVMERMAKFFKMMFDLNHQELSIKSSGLKLVISLNNGANDKKKEEVAGDDEEVLYYLYN